MMSGFLSEVFVGNMRKIAVGVGLAAVAIELSLSYAPLVDRTRSTLALVVLVVVGLASTGACGAAAARITGRDRNLFAIMALALLAWTAGCVAQAVYVIRDGKWPVAVSAEDIAFLVALGLLLYVSAEFGNPVSAGALRRAVAATDMLALFTVGGVVSYLFIMKPLGYTRPGMDMLRMMILLSYAALAAGLFLYPLLFRQDPWTPPATLAVAAFGMGAVMAHMTVFSIGMGMYHAGSPSAMLSNVPFVASLALLGMSGVWRMTMMPSGATNPGPVDELPPWPRIAVSLVTLGGVPIMILVALSSSEVATRTVMGVGVAVLSVLAISRNLLMMLEHRSAGRQDGVETRYRAIVESTPTAILVIDRNGLVLYANGVAAVLLGASTPYDLMGIDLGDLLPTRGAVLKERAEIEALLDAMSAGPLRPSRPAALRLTRMRTLAGEIIDVQRTASPIMYDGVPAIIFQGEDVTARLRAEREAQEYQERLRALATELVSTEERERRTLAEALHDRVGQALAVSRMRLRLAQEDGAASGADVDAALSMIDDAISETRTLTTELAPPLLYELGLDAALRQLCEEFDTLHGLSCSVEGSLEGLTLSEKPRAIVYRAVRELLMNVVKHAHAGHATIVVDQDVEQIIVTVADNGVGFDLSRMPSSTFGLMSVDESVRAFGGTMVIESVSGEGTRVRLTVQRS